LPVSVYDGDCPIFWIPAGAYSAGVDAINIGSGDTRRLTCNPSRNRLIEAFMSLSWVV